MALATTFLEPGSDATQDLTFWSSTSGTVASATDQIHTGTSSLKFSTGAGSANAQANTRNSVVLDSGSQISFYYRFDALPTSDADVLTIRSTLDVLGIKLTTTGLIKNNPIGATTATGSTTLSTNTWYRISISYYITNTTTYTCKVYIDGVLDSTTNAGTLTRTGSTMVRLNVAGAAGANKNAWFDDIYIATGGASSSSQPDTGNILVTAKRPNADGTTNGWTTQIGSGGSGYGSGHSPQVNERPLSTTNGWSIIGAGSAVTEEYNIESAATGDVDISSATIVDYMGWVYTKALIAETGSIILNGVSSNISITTSNALFLVAAGSTTYPAGTGTDIGEVCSTTVTTVSLFECGIIFAYTLGSSASSSISKSPSSSASLSISPSPSSSQSPSSSVSLSISPSPSSSISLSPSSSQSPSSSVSSSISPSPSSSQSPSSSVSSSISLSPSSSQSPSSSVSLSISPSPSSSQSPSSSVSLSISPSPSSSQSPSSSDSPSISPSPSSSPSAGSPSSSISLSISPSPSLSISPSPSSSQSPSSSVSLSISPSPSSSVSLSISLSPSSSVSLSPSSSISPSTSLSISPSPSSSQSPSSSDSASASPSTAIPVVATAQAGRPKPQPIRYDATLYRWDGLIWIKTKLLVWDGFAFIKRPLFFWDKYWKTVDIGETDIS